MHAPENITLQEFSFNLICDKITKQSIYWGLFCLLSTYYNVTWKKNYIKTFLTRLKTEYFWIGSFENFFGIDCCKIFIVITYKQTSYTLNFKWQIYIKFVLSSTFKTHVYFTLPLKLNEKTHIRIINLQKKWNRIFFNIQQTTQYLSWKNKHTLKEMEC